VTFSFIANSRAYGFRLAFVCTGGFSAAIEKKIFATMEIAEESVQTQIDTGASYHLLLKTFVPPGRMIT